MKNEYMRPAEHLSLPVVAGTKSGEILDYNTNQ